MKKNQPATQAKPAGQGGSFLLSLVIPCYNESARVDLMLGGLAEFQDKWQGNYEVIIVDDGSKDDTSERIRKTVDEKYPALKSKIRIERMEVNGGKGGALKRGVGLASGDYVLTLDADMSTRPVELINWQKRDKNLFTNTETIYIGSRKHEDGKVEALQSRRIIGGVFNSIVQIMTTLHLKDTQCGFKLYPRNVGSFLFENMQSTGWAHDVELLYQADLNDIAIVEMPINWVNQPESKVNVFRDSMLMLIGVISIVFRIWLYNTFLLPFRIHENATPEQRRHIRLRAAFNMLALLLVIVMPLLSFHFAITGDEHWHFKYGNAIYNYFFNGDMSAQTGVLPEENPPGQPTGIQYYGGLFDIINTCFSKWFHTDHYTTMHFFNALVGAVGIIYAGKTARLIGGWLPGLLTLVFLVLSPSWFGHNFANPKDIPFSVGYSAGVYFILLYVRALPRPNAKHVFGLLCAIGWAMGVRIGGLLLIAYLVLFIGVYALITGQVKAVLNLRVVRQILVVSVGGYLIAVAFWPYAQQSIIEMPLEALKVMSHFFVNIGLLYDGRKIFSNEVPWYYIPRYILYTAPLVVLGGALLSIVGIPMLGKRNRQFYLLAGMVLFVCVFPLAYAIHVKSSLYDGWRHFLFIYPPLVILVSLGFAGLMQSKLKYVVLAVIVAGLILPLKFMIMWHPFESLYYNEIAGGLKGIYGKFETDYYMLGARPATEWLIKNEHIDTRNVTIGTNCVNPVQAYLKPYGKDKSCVYVKNATRYSKDWDYAIMYSRDVDISQLISGNWPPAETVYKVTVDGVVISAVLKRRTHKDFAGFELLKAKKPEEAKAMFVASLQEFPENDLVWAALAGIYNDEGLADSAVYAGYRALSRDPGNIEVNDIIGRVYMKENKMDSAMALYNRLTNYDPGYGHFFKAITYASMGDGVHALSEVDATLDADAGLQQAYKLGVQIARQMKNEERANSYIERYKEQFPEQEK